MQLAYGFEARTQHQLGSSWHKSYNNSDRRLYRIASRAARARHVTSHEGQGNGGGQSSWPKSVDDASNVLNALLTVEHQNTCAIIMCERTSARGAQARLNTKCGGREERERGLRLLSLIRIAVAHGVWLITP